MLYLQFLIWILNFPLLTYHNNIRASSNLSMPQPERPGRRRDAVSTNGSSKLVTFFRAGRACVRSVRTAAVSSALRIVVEFAQLRLTALKFTSELAIKER